MEPSYIQIWNNNKKRKFYISKKPFYLSYKDDFIFSYEKPSLSFIKIEQKGTKIKIKAVACKPWDLSFAESPQDSLSLSSGQFFNFKGYDFFVELHQKNKDFVFTGVYDYKRFRPMMEAARTDSPIIITGDTGVGKELFAKNIHYNSHRKHGPFYVVNCASIDSVSLDSFLFGVKKGAYTGAKSDLKGLFKLADKGTIVLDNVDLLPHKTQVSLLRVLENKEVKPLGSEKSFTHNVRIIAITNKSFYELLMDSDIRKDLFYRLEAQWINMPLLKDRQDELSNFIDFFLHKSVNKHEKDILKNYSWPGNIREFKNYIEKVKLRGKFTLINKDKDILAWKNSFGRKLNSTLSQLKENYLTMIKLKDWYATKIES